MFTLPGSLVDETPRCRIKRLTLPPEDTLPRESRETTAVLANPQNDLLWL